MLHRDYREPWLSVIKFCLKTLSPQIIKRKFSTETGYYFREEVISRQEVIDAYLKINDTANKTNKRLYKLSISGWGPGDSI